MRRCGRVRLTGVTVRNAGIDWAAADNCYWRHRVARVQAARIVLHGQSEFEAAHVTLEGDQTFEVRARAPVLAQDFQYPGILGLVPPPPSPYIWSSMAL